MKVQNSTALVTGANRGLGLAFARGCTPAAPRPSTPVCAILAASTSRAWCR